jgi:hypothetical protein
LHALIEIAPADTNTKLASDITQARRPTNNASHGRQNATKDSQRLLSVDLSS